MVEQVLGLVAMALLGSGLAATNWLRLVIWQRFSTLLLHTALTHGAVLASVAWLFGIDFLHLAAWDVAIFAACYISYCAYLAQTRMDRLANFAPARYNRMSIFQVASELVLAFLDSLVYRAVYSWADFVPTTGPR